MKKFILALLAIFAIGGGNLWAKGIYKFSLGEQLAFEQAIAKGEGVAIVHNNRVLCDNGEGLRMVPLDELEGNTAWHFAFEEGTEALAGKYFIKSVEKNQYVNASAWSHTYFSGKNAENGEKGNGLLWTIAASGEKTYTIRNLGVEQGNYDNSVNNNGVQSNKGWLKDITDGYWKDHATWQNETGDEWSFYTLEQILFANTSWTWTKISFEDALTSEDPVVLVQNDLVITNSNGGVNYSTKEDFDNFAYWVKFETYNAGENQYYITLNRENGEKVNYFNAAVWSHVYLSGVDKEGTRGEKQNSAIFTIAEMGENQYSIRNLGSVEGCYGEDQQAKGYVNFTTDGYWKNNATWQNASPLAWEFYTVTDPQVIPIDPNARVYFTATVANTTAFDLTKAENYDLEEGKFTANGGWTFSTPKDFGDWKWLVVTTTYNASAAGGEFRVADADGNSIGGEEYAKGGGTSRGSMWIDRWNNQICATVNMEYLMNNGIDIERIASVTFSANQPVSAVYLTNYEAGQAVANTQGWGACTGDYVREVARLENGAYKFGTIALKYAAAVSGAQVYTVDSWENEVMTLAQHYGVLEAGVPYIYVANDHVGLNNSGNSNVNFFRVDANAVSGDWSDNNARDNGLVGYYDGGFWPGAGALKGCYILAQNELHKIDGGEIDLGKNRCFFDPAKCTNKNSAGTKVRVGVAGAEETAIKDVQNVLNSGKIYDMNGREVKQMEKGGMYIMGGMKVYIKK